MAIHTITLLYSRNRNKTMKLDHITIILIFIAITVFLSLIIFIALDEYSKSNTRNAIEQCGCNNKQCILNITGKDKIHISEWYKHCFNKKP